MPAAVSAGGAPAGSLSIAFCPCPPLLHPAVEGRPAEETTALRRACAEAVEALLADGPEAVVVVAPGVDGRCGAGDAGDLRGVGVDVEVAFSGGVRPGGRRTRPALTLGAWLLDQAGYAGLRLGVGPAGLAAALADLDGGTVGVLALGDGSARRSVKAPGYLDGAAAPFDAAVAAALAAGDAAALAALDAEEGERLLAAGVPVWRAVGQVVEGRTVTARLHHDAAPLGVGYLVASWTAAPTASPTAP